MPTINQLVARGRDAVKYKTKSPALQSSPQKYPVPTGGFAPYGRSLADAGSDSQLGGIQVPVLPTVRPGLPATGPADDDEDFWAKLRSRLKEGQVTEGTEKEK